MRTCSLLICLLGLSALVAGCQSDVPIAVYTVPHPDRQPLRLLALVIPQGEQFWFFKLSGPAADVERQKAAFDEFIASLRFDEKREQSFAWKVPPAWKEEPAGGMRLASFRIPAEPHAMELTFSKAGGSLMSNLNRWRKQLTLPALNTAELRDDMARRMEVDGHEAYLVDLTGLGTHAVAKPAEKPAPPVQARPQGLPDARQHPFRYDAPKTWEQHGPERIAVDSYIVREGEQTAKLTITPLGGAAGGIESNVNRWSDELGLPHLQDQALTDAVKTLPAAGTQASYVDLDNPKSARPNNRILAVILPQPDATWFFKLVGPRELVGRHKAEFEAFVRSVKLDEKE